MPYAPTISFEIFLMVLGLSFFFGLAYEEFYADRPTKPVGGVRSFPLLAILGLLLYGIQPETGLSFAIGLAVVGILLIRFHRPTNVSGDIDSDRSIVPFLCNLLAYAIGPVTLLEPIWLAVSLTVAAVLLLTLQEPLHQVARNLPGQEITTLAKFLILTGIVLPLLPDEPVTSLTTITPFKAWLALVAISTLSYASYLAKRYVAPKGSDFYAAILGGMYSSTATTIVLARRLDKGASDARTAIPAIILATSVMYLRLGMVVSIFNLTLALHVLGALLSLSALGIVMAATAYWILDPAGSATADHTETPHNPLELKMAAGIAALFVVVSIVSTWAQQEFGDQGLFIIAAIVGITDIDPFVLSVAQGTVPQASLSLMGGAILAAAASNNFFKAGCALVILRFSRRSLAASCLAALGIATAAGAYVLVRYG